MALTRATSSLVIDGVTYDLTIKEVPSHSHSEYLPKTTYEWNKQYAAGQNGALSLGRYNVYDSQLTFNIDSTTTTSVSGKLVIATQNGRICQAKLFGDAANTLNSYLKIYQSAITNNRSYIEIFCDFPGWSKNKVHIYGIALNSATVTHQMESVTFTDGVPSGVTSGDALWTGTIVNDMDSKANATHNHTVKTTSDTFLKTISGGSGTFTPTSKYLHHTHTAASLGTPSTSNAAPHTHTHTYDKTTGIKLTPNDASGTGKIQYVQAIGNAAPHTHTHSYGSSTALTTTANSGTAVTVLKGTYVDGVLTLTDVTVCPNSHTHNVTVSGTTGPNSGSAVTVTTKYLSAAPTTTSTNSGNNSGNAVAAVTGYPNFSGGSGALTSNTTASGGTKYIQEASHSHTPASSGTSASALTGVTVDSAL